MTTEQTGFNWDSVKEEETADNRPFLNFEDNGDGLKVEMIFEEDTPFHVSKDNYGNDKFIFKVKTLEGDKCLFSTSSKRCMRGLRDIAPLLNKAVKIERKGTGFDTFYEVEEI